MNNRERELRDNYPELVEEAKKKATELGDGLPYEGKLTGKQKQAILRKQDPQVCSSRKKFVD